MKTKDKAKITLQNVTKIFGKNDEKVVALDGLNLEIYDNKSYYSQFDDLTFILRAMGMKVIMGKRYDVDQQIWV